MKEIIVDLDKFRFDEFVRKMIRFAEEHTDPNYTLCWKYEIDDATFYNKVDYRLRVYLFELKEEKKILFFPFSSCNNEGGVLFADGSEHNIKSGAEGEINLSPFDCVGFLIRYDNEKLRIKSGINLRGCLTPPEALQEVGNCGIFDVPMYTFIESFIMK